MCHLYKALSIEPTAHGYLGTTMICSFNLHTASPGGWLEGFQDGSQWPLPFWNSCLLVYPSHTKLWQDHKNCQSHSMWITRLIYNKSHYFHLVLLDNSDPFLWEKSACMSWGHSSSCREAYMVRNWGLQQTASTMSSLWRSHFWRQSFSHRGKPLGDHSP